MVASSTLRKAVLRLLQDALSPLTINQLHRVVVDHTGYNYSKDEVFDVLCDLTTDGELLEETAYIYRRQYDE